MSKSNYTVRVHGSTDKEKLRKATIKFLRAVESEKKKKKEETK